MLNFPSIVIIKMDEFAKLYLIRSFYAQLKELLLVSMVIWFSGGSISLDVSRKIEIISNSRNDWFCI